MIWSMDFAAVPGVFLEVSHQHAEMRPGFEILRLSLEL